MNKILIKNARIIDAENDAYGSIYIEETLIKKVAIGAEALVVNDVSSDSDVKVIDASGKVLLPSFIDMHVHFRYPGQTEKEDLQSGLNAAVQGGFGTLVLMPNTKPIVSSSELSHSIEKEAVYLKKADVIQTVSITRDFSGKDISHLDEILQVPMVTEDGSDVPDASVMLSAMEKCADYGIIVGCHCEEKDLTTYSKQCRTNAIELMNTEKTNEWGKVSNEATQALIDSNFEQSEKILALAEDIATLRNLELAEFADCRIHIDHVSTEKSLQAIKRAKEIRGDKVTCEVTPHHFSLSNDNEKNLRLIVNPPIRSKKDKEAVLQAIKDGTVDVISTDHAPHTLQDKLSGSPGFPGLETSFCMAYTNLVKNGLISFSKLSSLMAFNPSHILGLDNCTENEKSPRGLIKENWLANLVLVDIDNEFAIDSSNFMTKGKICPFEGVKVNGKIESVFYHGEQINEKFF